MLKMELNIITEKMEELCTLLLAQKTYLDCKQIVEQFHADQKSIEQYERFTETQQKLQAKEKRGFPLTPRESDEFDREERALYENSIIRRYLYAQREFDSLKQLLDQYYTKTIEHGRLPKSNELNKITRGCGSAYKPH